MNSGFIGLEYRDHRNGVDTKVSDFSLITQDPLVIDFGQKEHTMIVAKSGSGKSYLAGVITEENIQAIKDTALIIFDRMGVFSTLDLENTDEKLISQWNSKVNIPYYQIKPKEFNIKTIIPANQVQNYDQDMYDRTFTIKPKQLTTYIFCLTFNIGIMDPQANLFRKATRSMKEDYSISDLIDQIQQKAEEWHFKPQTKDALVSKLDALNELQLFDAYEGIEINEITKKNEITVIDISCCDEKTAYIIVNFISERILRERSRIAQQIQIAKRRNRPIYIRNPIPQCHLIIDEAHNFLPGNEIFAKGIKEGRNIGIKFTCISQSPDLTDDLYANITHLFIGMINFDKHISFLKSILPFPETLCSFRDLVKSLEKGCFLYYNLKHKIKKKIRIRPRFSLHTANTEIENESDWILSDPNKIIEKIHTNEKPIDIEIYDPQKNTEEIEENIKTTKEIDIEKNILEWNEVEVEEVKEKKEPNPKKSDLISFSHLYSKLKSLSFSTIRRYDKGYEVGKEYYISLKNKGIVGKAKLLFKHKKKLTNLPTDFLIQDGDPYCSSREEFISLLNSFYQNPVQENEELTILRLEWITTNFLKS